MRMHVPMYEDACPMHSVVASSTCVILYGTPLYIGAGDDMIGR